MKSGDKVVREALDILDSQISDNLKSQMQVADELALRKNWVYKPSEIWNEFISGWFGACTPVVSCEDSRKAIDEILKLRKERREMIEKRLQLKKPK